MDVAEDAPIGPALVQIENDGTSLETLLSIEASGNVPWISVSPNWTAQGRRRASLELTANGFDFSKGIAAISFDDPAIRLISFEVDKDDPQKGIVTAELSPVAGSDMTVIYARVGEIQAAATFRVLDIEKPRVVTVDPPEITRGSTAETITIEVEGIDLGATLAEVMNGIGVNVTKTDVLPGNMVEVELVTEVTGPVGWIGILLTFRRAPLCRGIPRTKLAVTASAPSLPEGERSQGNPKAGRQLSPAGAWPRWRPARRKAARR